MTLWISVLLGCIEGLTEFFPISSTGHLIIAEKLLGITSPSLFFNTVIQAGAILAAVWYFRTQILEMIKAGMQQSKKTLWYFLLGSIPVIIVGAFFHRAIASLQTQISWVALTTLGIAFVMWWAQRRYTSTEYDGKKTETLRAHDYIIIGIFQSLAVIPGVSRSGITIIGGLTRKLSFVHAIEVAFILGIPAMAAATGFELLQTVLQFQQGIFPSLLLETTIGFTTAFFVSLFAIHATLSVLKKYGFTPFILYRIVLGIILLFLFPFSL